MAGQYKFEIYRDNQDKFRFRFVAPNGETMFSGQGYTRKQSVMNAIESIRKNTTEAVIDDQSVKS